MMTFGNFVREHRTRLGFSQTRFSKNLEKSQAWLSGVEQGERELPYTMLADIAEKLQLDKDDEKTLYDLWILDCGTVEIATCGLMDHQRQMLSCLLDGLEGLSEEQCKSICSVLK